MELYILMRNSIEGFQNPFIQIKRQQYHLENWLKERHFTPIPCMGYVVISNPATIIKVPKTFKSKIIHSANIPYILEDKNIKSTKPTLSRVKAKNLTDSIIDNDTEEDVDLLKKYNITVNDLVTGVQCPNCGQYPLIRVNGFWRCSSCQHLSKDAHLKALEEYKYLFGKKITTQKLRSFLHIPSRTTATKLFRKLQFPHTGTTKDRVYFID
ncbi:hypothetical protein [Metabacillus sp. Hm71]|uniref:hypothetical protein n=1 Tax=Metabacillus sp. Hm71 TaxID=3450743 RepID=UPI003F43DC12